MVSLLPFTSGGSRKEGGLRSRKRGGGSEGGGGGITSKLASLGGGGGGGGKGSLAPGRSIPNTILPTVQVWLALSTMDVDFRRALMLLGILVHALDDSLSWKGMDSRHIGCNEHFYERKIKCFCLVS